MKDLGIFFGLTGKVAALEKKFQDAVFGGKSVILKLIVIRSKNVTY